MAKSPVKKKKPRKVEKKTQVKQNDRIVEMMNRCKIAEIHYSENRAFCNFYWPEFEDYKQECFEWVFKKIKTKRIKKNTIKDGDPDQPLKGFLHLLITQLINQARTWSKQHNRSMTYKTVPEDGVKFQGQEFSIYETTTAENTFMEDLERESFLDLLMVELMKYSKKSIPLHHLLALRLRGVSLEDIGKQYGLTKEATRMYEKQIIAISKTLKK